MENNMINKDEQFLTNIETGLTTCEVQERVDKGLINGNINVPTKSTKEIFKSNFFTLFNFLNFTLGVFVLLVFQYKQALFLGIVFFNIFIGLTQELRSKKIIDKLALITAPKAKVLRDGTIQTIEVSNILMDDIMVFAAGNEICSDCILVSGELEVNESMLTGEQDAILKRAGDTMLSGSFIVSGSGRARVIHIGKDNYAAKISQGAKYIKKSNSQILNSVKAIIKMMTFVIIPLGIILFMKNLANLDYEIDEVVTRTVAQIIGMIPEGLVLLTSLVFAASVIRLAKHKTSVQDLYCAETLARVNVLCLDKTGTITTGTMQVDDYFPIGDTTREHLFAAVAAFSSIVNDDNPTAVAIRETFNLPEEKWKMQYTIPFSSARKYSACNFQGKGTYIIGAGEFILGDKIKSIQEHIDKYSNEGKRVLVVAHSPCDLTDNNLPDNIEPIGLILISDKIRDEAYDTLKYFAEQGVSIKVISGDNPITVSRIAEKAGLEGAELYVDATTLVTEEDMMQALIQYNVFGRVTPDQKLSFVKLLRKAGNTVAMTGDGVNDVLALKEADCSIAMSSGSDAARNVSSLVLLDNNFSSMPKVVAEGRRGINNLSRSASLFLIKTIYSTLFALIFCFVKYTYPFTPIQLTLISTCLVGIPSIALALEKNTDVVKGRFIDRAIIDALPSALCVVITIMLILIVSNLKIPRFNFTGLEDAQIKTISTISLGLIMYIVLFRICTPFSVLRLVLFLSCGLIFAFLVITQQALFELVSFNKEMAIIQIGIVAITIPLMIFSSKLIRYFVKKDKLSIMNKLLLMSENISMASDVIKAQAKSKEVAKEEKAVIKASLKKEKENMK